jgi:lipopolysaccharide/colanic/teichoic acid biosynthesis glycosyltransferase
MTAIPADVNTETVTSSTRRRTWFQVRPAQRAEGHRVRDAGRRVLNVVAAGLGLIISAPLMLAIAIAIKLTSKGPVFYSQARVGKCRRQPVVGINNARRHTDLTGKPFTIYKFRTMYADADTTSGPQVWAQPDDPRVTPVGKFLRTYRLDELPQLFNVLKGDMNIVGPRPEQPRIVLDLKHRVEGYPERHRVLPGITGWAQVNQSYDRSLDDVQRKVTLDLEYIRRRSAAEDARIMLRTVPVMLFKKGAW